ncbi:TIGR03086 family metal-binding protein [Nocardia pseudovaccinii]|uniref:TIGR03086 family metal-binding protein n=1 Tax=Nocardia pseudovaccinii TaxID=189540 RepID=UPI0007A3A27E|nr:TIGR03086 family metal-binding protein [Nocardia pseudovaccinii]
MDNVIGQIDRALDMTGAIVIAAVDGDRLAAPTPCQDWDVHAVLNHAVGNMHRFAAGVSGTDAGAGLEDDWLGIDPQGAFAAAAEVDRAAWHRPDALTGTVRIALGELPGPAAAMVHLTEVVAHAVDIAVAIDRPDLADDELCAELLTTMHAMGGLDGFRKPGMFDEEVTVPADAPAHRRLLGYLGRAW